MILFIITLCVAVMILSVALPVNIYRNESAAITSDEWTSDLIVTMKGSSDRRILFDEDISEAVGDSAAWLGEFSLTGFATGGVGEKVQTRIGAFKLTSADSFFEIRYLEYGKFTNNNLDRSCVVGKSYADKLGLSLGDTVTVNVLGEPLCYTVEGIAMDTGIFKSKDMLVDVGSIRQILAERSTLIASMSSDFNPYTRIHLKLKSGVSAETLRASLEAREDFADKKVETYGNDATQIFYAVILTVTIVIPGALIVIVAAMMTVSSLELVEKKRQSDNALFRTVGAEPRQLDMLVYLESTVYALVGGTLGTLLSVLGMRWLNGLYCFKWQDISFGADDVILGIGSALIFTILCAYLHVRKQRGYTLAEGLSDVNANTCGVFAYKKLLLAAAVLVLFVVSRFLDPTDRYPLAITMLLLLVIFIYVISPYIIGLIASLLSRLLSRLRRGTGCFILAAKTCSGSYPLKHAGRVMTVLLTVFLSLTSIVSAVDEQMVSYVDFAAFDYAGMYVDEETRERIDGLDGILDVSECIIKRTVVFDGGRAINGISVSEYSPLCFNDTIYPEAELKGNEIAISRGVAAMIGAKVGDTVECTVSDIPCTLVVKEIVSTHGDFVFYDAEYLGADYIMTCIRTDGTPEAAERLISLFDERGVECIRAEDFFRETHDKVDPQLTAFSVMLWVMVLMTVIGIINVLAEERIARSRELEIIRQNGMTRGGSLLLQIVEIGYLLASAIILSIVFSAVLIGIINMVSVSFGMTVYA